MNKKNLNTVIEGIIAVIIVALILLIISPLIYFLGWCTGWFTMITIGDTLVKGINVIFGTDFSKDILPTLGGVLSWIGSFFRGAQSKSKSDKQ